MANKVLRIKEILKEKDLTINDLAGEMGINRVTLSNIIKGNPTIETLSKIAHSLNVSIRELFCEEEENMSKIFRFDTIRKEFVFSSFDENVSLNINFTDKYINTSLKIYSKDIELINSSSINEEPFKELCKINLDIRDYLLKIVREGKFIIRIFSIETSLTLFEFESIIKAFEMFRKCFYSIIDETKAIAFNETLLEEMYQNPTCREINNLKSLI